MISYIKHRQYSAKSKYFGPFYYIQTDPQDYDEWHTSPTEEEIHFTTPSKFGSPTTPQSNVSSEAFESYITLTNFKKGIKRDASAYPTFKNERYYNPFIRHFKATAKAQGLNNLMDPNFTPGSDEHEQQLFQEQHDFLYSVLISYLKTEFSEALVKDHEEDAQLILDLLHEHHTGNSQYSIAEINRITKYLTNIKLDDTWIGTNERFLMHYNYQLHILYSLVDSDENLPDNARVTFLESAVEYVPDLRHVKITDNVLQAQLDSTRPISYRSYFDLLKDAAFHLDQATKRGNKIRRTNVHFSGPNDEDEHQTLSSDDNQVIQQENVCSEQQQDFLYSVLISYLKTEFSEALVKDHEEDAQLILDLLHEHHTGNSQYSIAEINRIPKYLTNIELDDTWTGTNEKFLMHYNYQLHILYSLVDSDENLPDNARVTFLESAVEYVPDLRHVKITDNVLQAQLDSTRPISYRSYFDLLKDAAFHLDQATKRGNKIQRTNVHFSGPNDEDEHQTLSFDENQVIQQENVCSEPPEPLRYSLIQSHFQGSSTSNTQKIFLPEPIWEKLSKDQQQMIIDHNRSLPKSGSPHLSTPNKNPSPLPHKPTPQQTAKSQQVHTHQSDESTSPSGEGTILPFPIPYPQQSTNSLQLDPLDASNPNFEQFVKSQSGEDEDNPIPMANIDIPNLLCQSFLLPPEYNGERHMAKIINIDDHGQPLEDITFKLKINKDQAEEITSYTQLMD